MRFFFAYALPAMPLPGLFFWNLQMNTISLKNEPRELITTEEAAHHLNREPQTLRVWACRENGPLRPVRVFGRLGWRVADIRKLVEAAV
jgi:hypothetical protein